MAGTQIEHRRPASPGLEEGFRLLAPMLLGQAPGSCASCKSNGLRKTRATGSVFLLSCQSPVGVTTRVASATPRRRGYAGGASLAIFRPHENFFVFFLARGRLPGHKQTSRRSSATARFVPPRGNACIRQPRGEKPVSDGAGEKNKIGFFFVFRSEESG